MHISTHARRLLKLVFGASSASSPLTRPALERRSGLPPSELNQALAELGRLGLLDARRLRLTLPGLALAVACGARSTARARSASRPRPAPKLDALNALKAPIALFSQREAPRAVA